MDIYLATSNMHKLDEFKQMLEPLGYNVKNIKIDNLEETGTTFEENAILKAKYINDKYGYACIADDSGLEVKALNNEPGIYSARYMGLDTDYIIKNNNIIDRLKDKDDRSARFVCAIAYVDENKEVHTFIGEVKGSISYEIIGEAGFGYDPIFYYDEFKTTLGNIKSDQKNKISHRSNALRKLVNYLENK